MRSNVRAHSHQGHGPRADQQAGYIEATSGYHASAVVISSRSIQKSQLADLVAIQHESRQCEFSNQLSLLAAHALAAQVLVRCASTDVSLPNSTGP